MRKAILAIVFLVVQKASEAQQHLVDSLTRELQQPMADSNRALSMMRLAIDYEIIDTAKAYKTYRDAISFASEKKLYYFLGRIYHNQSFLFSTAGNYPRTVSSLDTAIENYKKSTNQKARLWEANAYGDMANVLKLQNELKQAVQYYLKSISLFEKLEMEDKLPVPYCNLSSLFGDLREFGKQQEYAQKALAVAKKAGTTQNLFMAYFMLANSYSSQNDSKSAKTYLDSARVYFTENSNIDALFSYYLVSAQVFKNLNQLDSSFYYFKKCFEVSVKNNYSYGKAESQVQMGAIAILRKRYGEAETYLLAGIEEGKAINYLNILDEGYKYLSDMYSLTGRYKLAYEAFQKFKELNDSVISLDSRKFTNELEKKYESEKKDALLRLQRTEIQNKNILNYILLGGTAVVFLVSLLVFRNHTQRQKIQLQRITELETEKQLTATEAVLKGEEKERTRLAKDLHDGLGGMLSGIKYSLNTMKGNLIMTPENTQAFERSMDMLDSSIKEMRRVAHNMMPEALVKFGLDTALKDFCNDINQTGVLQVTYQSIGLETASVDQTTSITVYRIVQELINNSIKHAAAKTAIVQVSKIYEKLSVTVEDDGKGFDAVILKQSKGIGWSNIQNRVEFLKGKIDVQSEPGKGTSVLLEFNTN